MANSRKKYTLQEVQTARNQYRLTRSQRSASNRAELDDPTIPGIIDPSDGTLSATAVKADLDVVVPQWPGLVVDPGDSDTLILEWAPGAAPAESDYKEVASELVTAPVDVGATFPFTIKVPVSEMAPDGLYTLRYSVFTPNFEQKLGPEVSIVCDSTPPWKHIEPKQLVLPLTQLTDDALVGIPGGMQGALPAYEYSDWQQGDKVAFYWLTHPLPEDPAALPSPVDFVTVPQTGGTVNFPIGILQASQDQDYYAAYVLVDKAGNRSPVSAYTRVDVALGPLPSGLQPPNVPLALPDGLINLPDARLGVDVEILGFDNFKPRDRIEVTWGASVLSSVEVGGNPVFPIPVRVPSQVLRDEYDRTAGGEQVTSVSYRILRGTLGSGPQSIDVNVDFSYIGPDPVPDPDPDWPDPVNEKLLAAEVFGKSSQTLNTLTRADNSQDADLKFKLYDPLTAGEVIDFYWAGERVTEAQYTVQASDMPGGEITVPIPWSYILAAGNQPALPVHYSIHAQDSENNQESPATLVAVDAVIITPDAPVFEGLNPNNGWLTCVSLYADPDNPDSLEPAVRVKVPDLSQYLKDGDEVTLVWTPLRGRTGETVITDAIKSQAIALGGDFPVSGFTWLVEPYDTHILPTYDLGGAGNTGRGRIRYEFVQGAETITSLTTEVLVAMYNAAGSCDLLPKP